MGNCLKRNANDSDFFLITGEDARRQNPTPPTTGPPPPYHEVANDPILHPTPGVSRPVSQLTEEEQVKIAIRLGLLHQLPTCSFEEGKREKLVECIICMCDYEVGEELRYLPCLHTYHRTCIDDWLTRSFTCPACLDEVDIALYANEAQRNASMKPPATDQPDPEENITPQNNDESPPIVQEEAIGDEVTQPQEDLTETAECPSSTVPSSVCLQGDSPAVMTDEVESADCEAGVASPVSEEDDDASVAEVPVTSLECQPDADAVE